MSKDLSFTINYIVSAISFTCYGCGASLTISRLSAESIVSGTFCQSCPQQYWINWQEGILRNGNIKVERLDDD